MRAGLPALLFVLFCLLAMPARADDGELCRVAIAATERAGFIPDRLMQAIGVMESGRRGPGGNTAAWPWTINVEGKGEVYESKQAVIAAVQAHQARGARSIDVGCMQVNLMHHRSAFASLEQAFDPVANAQYAATFLQQLLAQTGSWPRAVAGYHSLTPEIGGEYARKVMAIWARPELGRADGPKPASGSLMAAAPPMAAAPMPGGAPVPSMPGAGPGAGAGHGQVTAGSTMPSLTGRGLDSYRSMPTRLVSSVMYRRS